MALKLINFHILATIAINPKKEEKDRIQIYFDRLKSYLTQCLDKIGVLMEINVEFFILYELESLNQTTLDRDHQLTSKSLDPTNLVFKDVKITRQGVNLSQSIECDKNRFYLLNLVENV